MEKRQLGKTGESLSIVGFGGIAVSRETPEYSADIVAKAVERGINYFDVAPTYGNAEERLGPALKPYRNGVFLACKTGKRDAAAAEEELHASLKRLHTDRFDLYQLHGVKTMDEVNQILGPGGALETFIKARENGLVRFLGFSAHDEDAAVALMNNFEFDTILAPFNWACWHKTKFGPKMLVEAKKRNMGILALKSLAKRKWREGEERRWSKTWYSPVDTLEEAQLAYRFTLSQPITSAVSPGHAELLWWMCDTADNFIPFTDEENARLAEWSQELDVIFPQS